MKKLVVVIVMLLMAGVCFAADFIVEKTTPLTGREMGLGGSMAKSGEQVYKVTVYKDAVDDKGNTVSVVDRTFNVTKSQLLAQKDNLQKSIDAIQAKIDVLPVDEVKVEAQPVSTAGTAK